MGRYCKPMGVNVTYLDCYECEGKECLQNRKEEKVKKVYLQLEPKQNVFLVFASVREGYNSNVIIKCEVSKITIYEDRTIYCCRPIKIVTKKKIDLSTVVSSFMFENANINTGHRGKGVNRYPVFTDKGRCLEWLKGN